MAFLRLPALSPRVPRQRRARGMTLIELMVVVVVVALLAAVALPSYQGSLAKARRTEARAALTACAQRMERYFTEKNSYEGATIELCTADQPASYQLLLPQAAQATGYVLHAVPRGPQGSDRCGSFTLNQDGVRGVGGPLSVAECW